MGADGDIDAVGVWMARWDPMPQSGRMPGPDAHGCPGWSMLATGEGGAESGDG